MLTSQMGIVSPNRDVHPTAAFLTPEIALNASVNKALPMDFS